MAQLAGMSIDYYIRLEQARGPRPSRQVLSALARALMLTGDERAHLFHLAGEAPAPGGGPSGEVPDGVLNMLESLVDTPAYVIDPKYDVLVWNRLAGVLHGLDDAAPEERNMIRWVFRSPTCAWGSASRGGAASPGPRSPTCAPPPRAIPATRRSAGWWRRCWPPARSSGRCGRRTTWRSSATSASRCTTR
nr:hypothetical protein GCM10020093_035350 [Planobispora longispora]